MASATTSDFLQQQVLDYLLKGVDWTPPSSLWVALFTTVPGLDGENGAEVPTLNTNYGRIEITNEDWTGPGASPNMEYHNTNDILFKIPTASWGTIQGAGLYDAETEGHLYYTSTLTTPKTVSLNDGAPRIWAGQFRIVRASA